MAGPETPFSVGQGQFRLSLDPFHRTRITVVPRGKLYQRGKQFRSRMSEGLQDPVSVLNTAQFGPRASSAGNDHLFRPESFLFQPDLKSLSVPAHFRHGTGGADLHARPFHCEAENIHHGIGRIGQRIDSPALFRSRDQADPGEHLQRVLHGELSHSLPDKRGIVSVIVFFGSLEIGKVASPVSGAEQLPAHPLLPFQKDHMLILFSGCGDGCHHPGGPAAYNCYCPHRNRFLSV